MQTFQSGDLIDYLELLGRDRALIYDCYGNTDSVTSDDICIWDPHDKDSPVAFVLIDG